MKDRSLEVESTSWLAVGLWVIMVIIGGALGLYGHVKAAQSIARCTESTIATISYENVESYLNAPYHGGEVSTRYRTYVTYSFTVDEYTYSINYKYENIVSTYPDVIDIIYNPNDPNEFWYNHAVISNPDTTEIEWYPNVMR